MKKRCINHGTKRLILAVILATMSGTFSTPVSAQLIEQTETVTPNNLKGHKYSSIAVRGTERMTTGILNTWTIGITVNLAEDFKGITVYGNNPHGSLRFPTEHFFSAFLLMSLPKYAPWTRLQKRNCHVRPCNRPEWSCGCSL